MSSAQHLKDFVSERLTAAAVEIFSMFQQTIVHYEEEIKRCQRRLLETNRGSEIKLHTTESVQLRVCEGRVEELCERPCHIQENTPHLNQDDLSPSRVKEEQDEPERFKIETPQEELAPPQIKEEQEECCPGQEEEQLALKEEPDGFMVHFTYGESDSKLESDSVQPLSHNSPTDQSASKQVHSLANENHGNDAVSSTLAGSQCGTGSGQKSANCVFLGKTSTKKSHLKKHRRIHTGERSYACEVCGKDFTSNDTLLVHLRTHTGDMPYVCNICGRKFTCPSAFSRHEGVHKVEKPYSCKTCGKTFRQKAHLIVHLRTHTGERPFICTVCGRRFIQTSNLNSHMRVHTDEKKYSCQFCGRSFKYKHSMLHHTNTQHK